MKSIFDERLLDKPLILLTNPSQKEMFLQSLSDMRVLFHGTLVFEDDYHMTLTDEGVFFLHDQLGWDYDVIDRDRWILEEMKNCQKSDSSFVNRFVFARNQLIEHDLLVKPKRVAENELIALNHVPADNELKHKIKHTVTLYPALFSPMISYSKDMESLRRDAFYQVVEWLKQGISPDAIHIHHVSMEDMVDLSMWLEEANIPFDDDRTYDIHIVPFLEELFELTQKGDVSGAIDWVKDALSRGIEHPSLQAIVQMISTLPIETWTHKVDYFQHKLHQLTFKMGSLHHAIHLHESLNFSSIKDYHIILNYTEEDLTRTAFPKQLSNEEQIQLGLPTSIDLMRQKKEQIILLLQQMPNVRALALSQGVLGHPQVFQDNLPTTKATEIKVDPSYAPRNEARYLRIDGKKEIPTFSGISPETVEFLTGGKLRLSASKLETFYECPFRYLLEDLLKIREDESTFAQFFGNYMHDVLDHLPDVSEKVIESILNRHQHEFPSSEILKWDIYRENILSATQNVLSAIASIQSTSKFERSVSEGFFETELPYETDVRLVGRIDALYKKTYNDKTVFAVVDYKTGKEGFRSADFRSLRQLQLLIYLYLIQHQPSMSAWEALGGFYQKAYYPFLDDEETIQSHFQLDGFAVKDPLRLDDFASEESLRGISTNKDGSFKKSGRLFDKNELEQLLGNLETLLSKTVGHIKAGHFWMRSQVENTIDLIPSGCEYCPFDHVCANRNHISTEGGDDLGIHETSTVGD